jgi:hypothetical protein
MKKAFKSMLFSTLLIAGITLTSCKDNNKEGEVDSMTATETETRETDVTVEPDNGMEMDTMTNTASDTITTP